MPRAKKNGGSLPKEARSVASQFSFKRRAGVYPPHVRLILEKRGSDTVKSLRIVRTPISTIVEKGVQWLSLGTFEPALKSLGYDKAMHLALEINGEYTLDKREVVTLVEKLVYSSQKHAETMDVPVNKELTLQQLFDNTRKQMGDKKFSNYSASKNNCQDFILGVLSGNGLLTNEMKDFIKQDVVSIFSQLPVYMEKVTDTITDVAAVANKVVEGESINPPPTSWKAYYASEVKGKKFDSRQDVNNFMRECSVKYKKLKN